MNQALAALPWVGEHSVDFAAKSATIVVNDEYDQAATLKAVTDLGFGAKIL